MMRVSRITAGPSVASHGKVGESGGKRWKGGGKVWKGGGKVVGKRGKVEGRWWESEGRGGKVAGRGGKVVGECGKGWQGGGKVVEHHSSKSEEAFQRVRALQRFRSKKPVRYEKTRAGLGGDSAWYSCSGAR